jgi:hypothetical protein
MDHQSRSIIPRWEQKEFRQKESFAGGRIKRTSALSRETLYLIKDFNLRNPVLPLRLSK